MNWRWWPPWRRWFHRQARQIEQIELAKMCMRHLDAQASHVEKLTEELIERQTANHFRQMFEDALARKGRAR